jgi:Ser/Thr protein kinase RdoA (MazF antagonist)
LDGAAYHRDESGNFWRAYLFIEGARTYDEVGSGTHARESARAFGEFQRLLLDLPAPRLHETIPDFHHTPRRFAALEQAVEADPCNRAIQAAADIQFAMDRKEMTGRLIGLLEAGRLPERVTHNDTKINNVMLDDATGRGVCVIDLDTVMPGLVLYDFGDEIRTTTATAAEDERDLLKVRFRLDMFEALVQGYFEAAHDFLTPAELDNLAFSGRLITFEIGIRFLADFLAGDVYFKTHRAGHNLDRARTQFEMVRQMEQKEDAMAKIVDRLR